jgi:hypothetical protein
MHNETWAMEPMRIGHLRILCRNLVQLNLQHSN